MNGNERYGVGDKNNNNNNGVQYNGQAPYNGVQHNGQAPCNPYAGAPVQAFNGGVMTLLVIGTLIIPLIGIITGIVNLKHAERNGQSALLLILGLIAAAINFGIITGGL